MKTFLIRRWFLLVLALALGCGMGFSRTLEPLARSTSLRQGIVVAVMFVMAFSLNATAIWDAVRRPGAALLGTLMNYGGLPLLSWMCCLLLGLWPAFSRDLLLGILIASTPPCTLASATVWTRRAGGNDATATMVTLITNLMCFLLTPAWLYLMLGRMPTFAPWEMVGKLGLLVVLPMVLAQVVRRIGTLGAWATEHKTPLGVLGQCGVLSMVFLGAIQTGERLAGRWDAALGANAAVMAVVVVGIHLAALLAGMWLAARVGLPRREALAVGFAGSQKTLMIGLEVCAQLNVTMLPMVTCHVGQLLADTLISDRLRARAVSEA